MNGPVEASSNALAYLVFRLGQEIYRAIRNKPCTTCGTPTSNRSRLCDACQSELRRKREQEREEARARAEEARKRQAEIDRRILAEVMTNRDYLLGLSPGAFESHIGQLFEALGYSIKVTKASHDSGVDVYLEKNGKRYVVQCKHFTKGNVSRPDVQQFYGVMMHEQCEEGFFVTTGRFTPQAIAFAQGKAIHLIDIDKLIQLLPAPGGVGEDLPPKACKNCGAAAARNLCETCLETLARLLAREVAPCVKCGARVMPWEERTDGLCTACGASISINQPSQNFSAPSL